MKKTISTNIAGVLFYIDEDGYEALRSYLESVAAYFSRFEGQREIVSDIENRIAEILMTRKVNEASIITLQDVEYVIATMGKVSDFQAAEAEEQTTSKPSNETQTAATGKKLFRDTKHKVLGGVCAGFGNYFGIDPVWLRVILALMVYASFGGIIVAYIALWFIVPGNDNLEEVKTEKRMYRDPEKRVLGGVAAGLAAYTGWDISLIRAALIISVLAGGLGVLVYLILWVALPSAGSLKEKMEMKGEPVTLTNIEKKVREKLKEKDGQESLLAKIILFPFRVLSAVLRWMESRLGSTVKVFFAAIRIFIGLIVSMIGISVTIALVITTLTLIGLLDASITSPDFSLPINSLRTEFSDFTLASLGLALTIPFIYIGLLGISLIANKMVFGRITSWSLNILFLASIGWLAFKAPAAIAAFKKTGIWKIEQTYNLTGKIPALKMRDIGYAPYQSVEVSLLSYQGHGIRITSRYLAQGESVVQAEENTKSIAYTIQMKDSTLTFDSDIRIANEAPFRAQRLQMDVFIPVGTQFLIEKRFLEFIRLDPPFHFRHGHGDEMILFRMDANGPVCINCPNLHQRRNRSIIPRDLPPLAHTSFWEKILGLSNNFKSSVPVLHKFHF